MRMEKKKKTTKICRSIRRHAFSRCVRARMIILLYFISYFYDVLRRASGFSVRRRRRRRPFISGARAADSEIRSAAAKRARAVGGRGRRRRRRTARGSPRTREKTILRRRFTRSGNGVGREEAKKKWKNRKIAKKYARRRPRRREGRGKLPVKRRPTPPRRCFRFVPGRR